MASNFFVAFNFYAMLSTAASFAISDLGVSETRGGIGSGIFVVGALLARIFLARYASRIGFKRTLFIGIGSLIVFTALLLVVNNFWFFLLVRFFGGMTFGINNNTLMTMVSITLPAGRKGEGVGWFSLSQNLGMALGPFFAVSIMHQSGFKNVFLLVTTVAIAAFVVIIFVSNPEDTEQNASAPLPDHARGTAVLPPEERGIWRFFERNAVNIAILSIILYACNSNYMSFAAISVSETGAATLSSAIFLVSAGIMLVSRPIIGKLFDRNGPNRILVCGFIIYAAGYFLLSRGIIPAFLPAAALIGLGISALQGATLPIVVINAPKHRLTIANATYFFALDFGAAIGPIFGGQIVEHTNYGTMYIVCAIIVALCIPLYFGVLARKPKPLM